MCGISGFIGNKNITKKNINLTLNLMKNRGPDKQDYFHRKIDKKRQIYLLHSRLSIIDLKDRSHQPFFLGSYILIFNGEIYNYLELKEKINKIVDFKTKSDTEVILHYFKLYGPKCFDHFEGMWSLAIFDTKKNKLVLSRDRFGEKPLYIMKKKEGIYFGSEIKYIKKLSDTPKFEINFDKINHFLQFGYKSIYKNNDSFFKNIYQISSSSFLEINKNLKTKSSIYWQYNKKINNKLTLKKTISTAKNLFTNSLKLRLRSDVPIALCLSGGIDSSTIASFAKKKINKKLETFSIIDDKDLRYNESKNIKYLIKRLNLKNNYIYSSKKLSFERLAKQIEYHDAPVFTITNYLQNFLAEKISDKRYKVVISGSGADEIFSGYYDHHLMYLYEVRKNKKLFNTHLNSWKKYILPNIRNKYFRNQKLFFNNKNERSYIYDHNVELRKYFVKPLLNNFKEKKFSKSLLRNRMFNETFFENIPIFNHSEDLNFMQYSVENRSPFLSRQLFEFMNTVPIKYLMQKGFAKFILREIGKNYVPSKIRLDRKKRGFNSSINSIINIKSKKFVKFINKNSKIYDIVNKKEFLKGLENLNNENYLSKFIFSFISVKIFLEKNK